MKRRMKYEVDNGCYVRFSIRPDKLRMYLLPEGREVLRDARIENKRLQAKAACLFSEGQEKDAKQQLRWVKNELDLIHDLLEDFLGNGWEFVRPEQVGDLRDDNWLVITRNAVSVNEDNDDILIVGTAYSHSQYAIESYIAPLVRKGYVDWERHDYLDNLNFIAEIARRLPDLVDNEHECKRLIAAADAYNALKDAEAAGQKILPLAS